MYNLLLKSTEQKSLTPIKHYYFYSYRFLDICWIIQQTLPSQIVSQHPCFCQFSFLFLFSSFFFFHPCQFYFSFSHLGYVTSLHPHCCILHGNVNSVQTLGRPPLRKPASRTRFVVSGSNVQRKGSFPESREVPLHKIRQ